MNAAGPVIALAGNPNCGKTSLFNFITGSRQHVANYPGVTVEKKEGSARIDDATVTFVDLPGTYSLTPYSPEESIAMKEIISDRIDGIIVVVDTTRLERNLYLVSQIIEAGKPVALALNMWDEFSAKGGTLDLDRLRDVLGVPCVPTVGNRGRGVTELMATALKAVRGEIPAEGKPPRYDHEMEHAIDDVLAIIGPRDIGHERWAAVNLLHYGRDIPAYTISAAITPEDHAAIDAIRDHLKSIDGLDVSRIVTAGRYGFAAGAVKECIHSVTHEHMTLTDRLDTLLIHRIWGIPIFLVILWGMFQMTFTLGAVPVGWIEWGVHTLGRLAAWILPGGIVESLVVDGIIGGVGGVIVFLPNIMLLFLFISLLEDTGYMARAAFIMDKIMHSCGLHGKSFIPMLVGFGCSVPAMMATRTLESRRDRFLTMFIIPFMSCGARLPVYILLASAFFSPSMAGTVIFSIYLIGVAVAFVVAKAVSSVVGSSTSFVMELPPYRIPTLRSVLIHIWERAWLYLHKAGTVILTFSIIMWAAMTFPHNDTPVAGGSPADQTAALEHSYAGQFGKFIEPALKPLGFDWRIGVALTAGFAAKEVVVSTLGTIYSINGNISETHASQHLVSALRNDSNLSPVKAYALMIFILLYLPCMAVLGILKREAGGWKWVLLMIVYTTSLAWAAAFSFTRIAQMIS